MSHGTMTISVADQYRVQQRSLTATEVSDADRERKINELRKRRRMTQLREEYRTIKDYHVIMQHPQTGATCSSFSLEELFEMFTLTQDWRDAVL